MKTRLGTVRTPYEHFYAWRRVNEGDAVSTLPFAETETMIKGVYAPERFMEILGTISISKIVFTTVMK